MLCNRPYNQILMGKLQILRLIPIESLSVLTKKEINEFPIRDKVDYFAINYSLLQ